MEGWKKVRELTGLGRVKELVMPEPGRTKRLDLSQGVDDVLVLGGNRAAKTTLAGKLAVEVLMGIPNARVACFHEDSTASIDLQQPVIYRTLPPELRDLGKKGKLTNVCYTAKNGFSEDKFILPNGSQCVFKNYAQYAQNQSAFEGGEYDLVWCDELVPAPLLDTLRLRLVTRGGLMLVTFTPLKGYSPAVRQYLDGAEVEEAKEAELLPGRTVAGCAPGHMPYVLRCFKRSQRVVFFHSKFNPYNPWPGLVRALEGKSREDVMTRAYGWPTKMVASAFPKFGEVHLLDPAAIPKAGTNYCVVDNHGDRNWFIVWGRVTPEGRRFVYREWPDMSVGAWAEPSEKADGRKGPAQHAESGKGTLAYKQIILEAEGWVLREQGNRRWWDGEHAEKIHCRFIDPRGGSMSVPGVEDGTSVIEMMLQVNMDRDGNEVGPFMQFMPAPSEKVDAGTGLINDALDYRTNEAVTVLNCPQLYVSRECKNVEYALRTWTGMDREKGATKDPVDCLKMWIKTDVGYVDPDYEPCEGGDGY